MGVRLNLLGAVFGKLTVLEFTGINKQGATMWRCQCECGSVTVTAGSRLRGGTTKSCGCAQIASVKARAVHGHARLSKGSRTYVSWMMMRQRCQNPNATGYHNYGGRGICVCKRWQAFEAFLADMGERPEGTSLDRIDNNKNYGPSNCRWATKSEQQKNTRWIIACAKEREKRARRIAKCLQNTQPVSGTS